MVLQKVKIGEGRGEKEETEIEQETEHKRIENSVKLDGETRMKMVLWRAKRDKGAEVEKGGAHRMEVVEETETTTMKTVTYLKHQMCLPQHQSYLENSCSNLVSSFTSPWILITNVWMRR